MKVCEYGCGQKSKYQFKNGKWCCSKHWNSCPKRRKNISEIHKGKKISEDQKIKVRKKLTGRKHTKEAKLKISLKRKGRKLSKEQKRNLKESKILSIRKIKNRYLFFSKIEEMRYNPDKPGEKEIQVHCKNHLCENSKEKLGWFSPSRSQLSERIRALESPHGMIENNFYCSEKCKYVCPLYNLKSDPFEILKQKVYYTQGEYQVFRKFVLERDGYKCKCCNRLATDVHHERPQKLEPFFALDPDFAWSFCKECHYKHGHKTGTECSTGNLAKRIC